MNKYSSFYRVLRSYYYLLISTSIAFTFKLDGDFSQAQQGSVRWSGLGVRSLLGRIPIPGRLRWTIKTAVEIWYMTFINSDSFVYTVKPSQSLVYMKILMPILHRRQGQDKTVSGVNWIGNSTRKYSVVIVLNIFQTTVANWKLGTETRRNSVHNAF